ncbi:MAG TPA: nucleoside triphosphate pyrophosphohydrolase [Stellaceae bacterium]|nr:nucleoside triphosphate pyrophosphohydrolase [Stellaceae bacterium]
MNDAPPHARTPDARRGIDRLIAVMARLRHRETGCPWDIEQSFATIAPYTIEEAYEVADAITRGDLDDLKDELGDLLLQVAFHARMAEEAGAFDFDAVANAIAEKMIRRHPHVFGDQSIDTADAQTANWEMLKAAERAAKAARAGTAGTDAVPSALDGVTIGLPGLTRAVKLQARAARVGFDWTTAPPILDKIAEELDEVRVEMETDAPADRLEDEVGDLLFAVANLARHLKLDPEAALRRANGKFERRFRGMEALAAAAGETLDGKDLPTLDALWDAVKAAERG